MEERNQQKLIAGCCLAAFALFALANLVMHFSFAGLLILAGAVLAAAGIFIPSLQALLPCGFAAAALAYVIEFVWYLIQSFQRGFRWLFLLFPVLACLLMVFIFAALVRISLKPENAKVWGALVTAAAFAAMLLVVGTVFAGFFKNAGEVNYFVFLQRLALIPAGWFFGLVMDGAAPLMKVDLSFLDKFRRKEEPKGQVIGYTPDYAQNEDPDMPQDPPADE